MSLRVVVQVWCEVDPTLNVRVDRQSAQPLVDPGDRLWRVSPLGRSALAAALKLGDAVVTAFALGSGHTEALRHALAGGAGHAVELLASGANADAIAVAALAEWLREQTADLVIADRLAGRLAARLGWSHLAGLDELRIQEGKLRAVRRLQRGDREEVTARLPAVVRLQEESPQAPYVARARIQAASGCTIAQEVLPGPDSPRIEAGPLQPARVRTRLGKAAPASSASASDRLQALMGGGNKAMAPVKRAEKTTEPDQLAEEFLRYLLHHELLPRP
jgi:electron transfer flavoprotein alpha/beta subunit